MYITVHFPRFGIGTSNKKCRRGEGEGQSSLMDPNPLLSDMMDLC